MHGLSPHGMTIDKSVTTPFVTANYLLTGPLAFIYSCPSGSPIKHRMLYSSGMLLVYHHAKGLLEGTPATLLTRKVETSDPKEINEHFLKSVLGANLGSEEGVASTPAQDEQKPMFARPKGPPRRR